jgi:hypothetical protein
MLLILPATFARTTGSLLRKIYFEE